MSAPLLDVKNAPLPGVGIRWFCTIEKKEFEVGGPGCDGRLYGIARTVIIEIFSRSKDVRLGLEGGGVLFLDGKKGEDDKTRYLNRCFKSRRVPLGLVAGEKPGEQAILNVSNGEKTISFHLIATYRLYAIRDRIEPLWNPFFNDGREPTSLIWKIKGGQIVISWFCRQYPCVGLNPNEKLNVVGKSLEMDITITCKKTVEIALLGKTPLFTLKKEGSSAENSLSLILSEEKEKVQLRPLKGTPLGENSSLFEESKPACLATMLIKAGKKSLQFRLKKVSTSWAARNINVLELPAIVNTVYEKLEKKTGLNTVLCSLEEPSLPMKRCDDARTFSAPAVRQKKESQAKHPYPDPNKKTMDSLNESKKEPLLEAVGPDWGSLNLLAEKAASLVPTRLRRISYDA